MFQLAMLSLSLVNASPQAQDLGPQFNRWERRLRAKVALLNVVSADAANDPACDVTIGFEIGDDGRPQNATIRESSCKPYYERAAHRLVRQLGRIGAVPSAIGVSHPVTLKLSYGVAPTAIADRQLTESLEAERRAYGDRNMRIVTAHRTAEISR
jgi:TonB family protein